MNYYQFCTKLSRAFQRLQRHRCGQVVLQLAGGGMQVLSTGDIYYLETHDRLDVYKRQTLFRNGTLQMAFCWNIAQQLNSDNNDAGLTNDGDEIKMCIRDRCC